MKTKAVLFMTAAILLVGFIFATAQLTTEANAAGKKKGQEEEKPGNGPPCNAGNYNAYSEQVANTGELKGKGLRNCFA